MQQLSEAIISELTKRNKEVIPVVEIYPRTTEDIASISAPASAIGRFSIGCVDWNTTVGTHRYEAKVLGFPEVSTYLGDQVNNAEIKFGNATRGDGSMSKFILDNNIKGCWMVIRLIFPNITDSSIILFWGKCGRPGEIDNTSLTLTATQDLGNYSQQIPFRSYQVSCPLEFARAGSGCLGDQTLTDKSISFQERVSLYGTAGCNKSYSTCVLLENTKYFQGQRVVAVSGQFSYVTIEEVVKRVLFWTTRKKVRKVKTDNWSSVNQSDGSSDIPLPFGRCQIEGHPFTWADEGERVYSLQGFCEGRISAFSFVRSRTEGINIVSQVEHLGDWGGVGTQGLDTIFNGTSGYNSRLAYLEVITDGSSPTQVDDAPLITAVVRGLELPVPNGDGVFASNEWTNNPTYVTRFLLTDLRFGRIPVARIDDDYTLETAAICDSIVEDRTNDEVIVLPANEAENYGVGYRRFRSAGRYTAYREQYLPDGSTYYYPEGPPEFEEPFVSWFNPFQPYVLPRSEVILRQKYTLNGAIQEKTSILDFLTKRVLPTFKGFINYGFNGKIQIRTRKKADNGYVRMDTHYLDNAIAISNVKPWKNDLSGFLLIGVSLQTAEIREVLSTRYSTACNGMPVTTVDTGSVTSSTSGTLSGGSDISPAVGYIDISGTVEPNAEVKVTFNTGVDEFYVSYIADGVEDIVTFTTMLRNFLNANLQFQSYLTAYTTDDMPQRIWLQCEAGYLDLDEPLEYAHTEAEEVMRVVGVFENCGELTANTSARFDNIIADSFKWNTDQQDDINAVTAAYTSAIDDFHLAKLSPRAAWDTIDLEGQLNTEELDLTLVDNYWQAAYLTKSHAIERIDGNLFFRLDTGILAARLELGDVVAVRHDSGDGALNYVPVTVEAVSTKLDDFVVSLQLKLYLSAAFDLHVQPIDVLLTTTLNPSLNPDSPPPALGTNGGISQSSEPNIVRPGHDYYAQFNLGKYSATGVDIV